MYIYIHTYLHMYVCVQCTYIYLYIYINSNPFTLDHVFYFYVTKVWPHRRHAFEHDLLRTFSVMGMKPLTCFVMEPMHFLVNNTLQYAAYYVDSREAGTRRCSPCTFSGAPSVTESSRHAENFWLRVSVLKINCEYLTIQWLWGS